MATTQQTPHWAEIAARAFEPDTTPPRWAHAGAMAQALNPAIRETPALRVIHEALIWALRTPNARLIVSMPPQEGKSTAAARQFPLFALCEQPDRRVVVASHTQSLAEGHAREVRTMIETHPTVTRLRISRDQGAKTDWQLDGHVGGMLAVGIGGALTGRACDLLIIDDPVKDRAAADSETMRDNIWDWYTDTAKTRLAPGAPVILIMTRWHEDDLAGRLLAQDDEEWREVAIPAECTDPETDLLGRELGEFMESARGRSQEDWQRIKLTTPARTWSAMYQQRPTPAEGAVWQRHWIDDNRRKTGEVMQKLRRIVVSVDPAAKSKDTSDLTGIVVVGSDIHNHGWVFDDRSLRGTPVEWGEAVWDAVLDWGAAEVVIEDNQGGEMVIEVLRNSWIRVAQRRRAQGMMPRVTPVNARRHKRVRAEAAAALYELGTIHHANDDTDRLVKLEHQMVSWTGDGDSPDRIDALGQGLDALFQNVTVTAPPPRPRRDRTRR